MIKKGEREREKKGRRVERERGGRGGEKEIKNENQRTSAS